MLSFSEHCLSQLVVGGGGVGVGGGGCQDRDTTAYFSKYFSNTVIYQLQILLLTARRHQNRLALFWEDQLRGDFQLCKVRQTDT